MILAHRCTWEYPIGCLFDSLCKIENWEPAYHICYCLLSSGQQRKMWKSCCNARPQTSSHQTYGLLTVLTLILWITGYVEYCSNVFIGNLLKTECCWTEAASFWLKCGLASSKVMLIRQLTNGEFTLMHVSKLKEAFWKHAMMCCSTTVNNLLWNLHSVIFCFTTFNQSWLLKF